MQVASVATDGSNEIDAVVLSQPDRARVPVAVGEAKWAKRVTAARVVSRIAGNAAPRERLLLTQTIIRIGTRFRADHVPKVHDRLGFGRECQRSK